MFIKPMLAKKMNHDGVPDGDYVYETKWDGIRAIVVVDQPNGKMQLFSRRGRDITLQFPEIAARWSDAFLCSGIFDAEIVCLKDGVPHFPSITSRLHLGSTSGRIQGMKDNPATMVLFDVLEVDGKSTRDHLLLKRKEILAAAHLPTERIVLSKVSKDGHKLYKAEAMRGAEGIIAKRRGSKYLPGRRTQDWLKVKIMYEEEVIIYGFTLGLGKRDHVFGALLFTDETGIHQGNVGTGFTDFQLESMWRFLHTRGAKMTKPNLFVLDRPFRAIVKGMKKNESGAIREPVFVKSLA